MVANPGKISNNRYESASSLEWIENLIYTVVALSIQFILGHDYAFPDGINGVTERAYGTEHCPTLQREHV
jgi:hypothetical protein